jgi:SAM-dependent methyltransferase
MAEELISESNRLRNAWNRHDSDVLDRYLVSDVEDPRINVQSIISRGFLIDSIWPDEFTGLIREEIRFGICLSFILRFLKGNCSQASRRRLLEALENGAVACSGAGIPPYLRLAFESAYDGRAELPDYITEALAARTVDGEWLPDSALSTFEHIWHRILCGREADRISVIEPACGSANDYRYLDSFGVGGFLEYTGFDICDKNIANARRRFPGVRFEVGNVLSIAVEDGCYDYLFVHDLFEHLSPAALHVSLSEICRVTRKQACLSFFNMANIDEHIIKPAGPYHWNRLSFRKVQEVLMNSARHIDVIHIDAFLKDNYGCADYHNKEAYTFIVSCDGN